MAEMPEGDKNMNSWIHYDVNKKTEISLDNDKKKGGEPFGFPPLGDELIEADFAVTDVFRIIGSRSYLTRTQVTGQPLRVCGRRPSAPRTPRIYL